MKVSVTKVAGIALVAALLGAGAARGFLSGPNVTEGATVTRTEVPAEFILEFQRLSSMAFEAQADGFFDRVKDAATGREVRAPDVIVKTDTIVVAPDSVSVGFHLDGGGTLSVPTLHRVDSLWAPEIVQVADVWDCEQGLAFSPTGNLTSCNTARFGHLFVAADAIASTDIDDRPVDVAAGLRWSHRYRSPWEINVRRRILEGRWEISVTTLFEIPLP